MGYLFICFFLFQIFCEILLGMECGLVATVYISVQLLQEKPHLCVQTPHISCGSHSHLVLLH